MKIKKTNKKTIFIIFVLSLLLAILIIARTMSKYIMEQKDTHIQESTAFYFDSEIAGVDNGKQYNKKDWDGTTQTIQFSTRNYENNLLKTDENIIYKISAKIIDNNDDGINDEDLIYVVIYDDLENVVTEEKELTLLGSNISENNYKLKIIPKVNDLEKGKEFNIKLIITSITPYEKNLTSTITIAVDDKEAYEANLINSENGEYVTLNLKMNDSQPVTINYDNTKLILDKSSYIVSSLNIAQNGNIDTFTIAKDNLEKGCNYEIDFIKIQSDANIILGTDITTK